MFIEKSSLEQVARIAAWLTDADGQRGQPKKLESLLLLKIAHLMHQESRPTLHAAALEVGREAHEHRKHVDIGSFITRLERDFRQQRHTWKTLARRTPMPSPEEVSDFAKRRTSTGERRAVARIAGLLPTQIDLYDSVVAEAGRPPIGNVETQKLLRSAGRDRVESWLIEVVENQRISNVRGRERPNTMGRVLLDLIEPKLQLFREESRQSASPTRVGRKSTK
jgi:hypothetical protein